MFKLLQVDKTVILFVIRSLRPFVKWMTGLFFVTLGLALSYSFGPYALKKLLNFLMANKAEQNSWGLEASIIFYLLASLFTVIIFRIHNFMWINIAPPLRCHITKLCMQYSMSHSYDFFQTYPAVDMANKIKETVAIVPEMLKTIFDGLVCGFLTLIIAMSTVLSVDYKFSIGLGVWVAIYVIGSFAIFKRTKKLGGQGLKLRSSILAKIAEILDNIRCVRLFAREEFEKEKLGGVLNQYLVLDQEKERYAAMILAFQGFSFVVYQAICLLWLMKGLKRGVIEAGDVALIVTINLSFVDFFRKIARDLAVFADNWGIVHQSLKILLPMKPFENTSCSRQLTSIKGEIVFENVCFNYHGQDPLFKNESIFISPGEKVAIVGPSGSGKSTFLDLILRLHEISWGNIFIDKNHITEINFQSLRNSIGVIPQKPTLFCGTIKDNIRYGRIDATELEIIEAAKKAEIHEFISSLPYGYETVVDSLGVVLSAGQLQRIAIARFFLKNAPILILDEAMTYLDTFTERRIEKSLMSFMQGKTTLIATHRFTSLILSADKILVFERGKSIKCGKHAEHLAQEGIYKKLWESSLDKDRDDFIFSTSDQNQDGSLIIQKT